MNARAEPSAAGRRRRVRPLAALVALAIAVAPGAGRTASPPPALRPVEIVAAGPGRPRILLAPRPGEVAALRVTFTVGSMDDGSSPGLTRLAQYALLEANRRVASGALAREVWAAAGRLEVVTGHRTCAFTLVASRRDFGPLLRRLLPALFAPQLDAARLPAAVARAALDVGQDRDLVTVLAGLGAEARDWRAHPPHGRRPVLESIEAEDVEAHLARGFTPARAEVVVAGAFDRSEVLALLRPYRGGTPAPLPRLTLEPGYHQREAARETHLLAYSLRLPGAREAAAARVLAALLDGALWREMREAGFAYSFDVEVVRSPWLDALTVVVPGQAGDGRSLGDTLDAILERIATGGFTDDQLQQARETALAELAATDAAPERLAEALAGGGTGWHGPAVAEAIAALDRAALLGPAREWLQHPLALHVGPAR